MALHVVNHVLKSRELVLRNNLRLKKNSESEARDQVARHVTYTLTLT